MSTTPNTTNITHLQMLFCEEPYELATRLHVGASRQLAPERAIRAALLDSDGMPLLAPWDGDTALVAYGATAAHALNALNALCSMEEPVQFTSIEQVQAHKWAGNAHDDNAAQTAMHTFIQDATRPMEHRAIAIYKLDESYGSKPVPYDNPEDAVNDYLDTLND